MPELLLEIFCEEIPARMQLTASEQLEKKLTSALNEARLDHGSVESFVTPRRLAIRANDLPEKQQDMLEERKGPKVNAPKKAIEGFLKSAGLTIDQLEKRTKGKDEFYFAVTTQKGRPTADVLKAIIENILASFHWPKSMRWNRYDTSWVRPLQNILCIFGSDVVPVEFSHLTANDKTYGHRFMSPEAITITDTTQYEAALEKAHVIANYEKRQSIIKEGATKIAKKAGVGLLQDDTLLQEVAGLVEFPVILAGNIDKKFMDLPHEVLVSEMRSHQKYFNTVKSEDSKTLANSFIITANILPPDGGKAVMNGNERVLRARLEDARFFWDNDRNTPLEEWAEGLQNVLFHAKIGAIAEKVTRISELAIKLNHHLKHANNEHIRRAAKLCKADLTTGMVGEFPELQGIMGEYYAMEQNEDREVALAIREHYQPQGPADDIPSSATGTIISLADKLDTICSMFAIGEKPTGSKDPFALRRAALGIIRIILENKLRIGLNELLSIAYATFVTSPTNKINEVAGFFIERLKVQLKESNIRHDVIDAVLATGDDDMVQIIVRAEATQEFIHTADGENLLSAYNRASNILEKEEKKHGSTYNSDIDSSLLKKTEEIELFEQLSNASPRVLKHIKAEEFVSAMHLLAQLRPSVDAFFDDVMVNDSDPHIRDNRLKLIAKLRESMNSTVDFSKVQSADTTNKKAA